MKKYLTCFVFAGLLLGSRPVFALDFLELRVGGGVVDINPDDLNKAVQVILPDLEFKTASVFNFDALVKVPVIPVGLGVRVEQGQSHDDAKDTFNNGAKVDLNYTRYAMLANWRILNNKVFLGPIGSFGFQSGNLKSTYLGSTKTNLSGSGPSVSLGMEGGVKFSRFLVGVEVGYQYLKLKSSSSGVKPDLSGPYIRLLTGVRF